MRPINFLITLALLGVIGLGGCTLAPPPAMLTVTPTSASFLPLGHWEVMHQINFSDIPETDLKGNIGPAYRSYLVTMAGFHTDRFGFTVGPEDDVRYTTDSGQSWTKAPSELFWRHGLEIVDEKVAWNCGEEGTRVSTNGGQSWQTVAPSAYPYLSFLDAQTGWAASPHVLQATFDGGASWDEITLPSAVQSIATIALRTASDGYILDKAGNLFVTTDGGRNWEIHSLGLTEGQRLIPTTDAPRAAMRFVDAQHGMVVFDLSDGTVWFAVTSDGGQSWQSAEIPELRNQAYYYHLYLTRNGRLLTVTDDFIDANLSIVLRYQQSYLGN